MSRSATCSISCAPSSKTSRSRRSASSRVRASSIPSEHRRAIASSTRRTSSDFASSCASNASTSFRLKVIKERLVGDRQRRSIRSTRFATAGAGTRREDQAGFRREGEAEEAQGQGAHGGAIVRDDAPRGGVGFGPGHDRSGTRRHRARRIRPLPHRSDPHPHRAREGGRDHRRGARPARGIRARHARAHVTRSGAVRRRRARDRPRRVELPAARDRGAAPPHVPRVRRTGSGPVRAGAACPTCASATPKRRRARARRSASFPGLGRQLRTALLRQAVRRSLSG